VAQNTRQQRAHMYWKCKSTYYQYMAQETKYC
jgi:hypothetical protein